LTVLAALTLMVAVEAIKRKGASSSATSAAAMAHTRRFTKNLNVYKAFAYLQKTLWAEPYKVLSH
jgi:hypothetical protein